MAKSTLAFLSFTLFCVIGLSPLSMTVDVIDAQIKNVTFPLLIWHGMGKMILTLSLIIRFTAPAHTGAGAVCAHLFALVSTNFEKITLRLTIVYTVVGSAYLIIGFKPL